jgi:hypothetical protein
MIFTTLAQAKLGEIKTKCTKLSDAIQLASDGITKWRATSNRSIYTYADGSRVVVMLEGYCYHDSYTQEKVYLNVDENIEDKKDILGFGS